MSQTDDKNTTEDTQETDETQVEDSVEEVEENENETEETTKKEQAEEKNVEKVEENEIPDFRPGDSVKIQYRIIEGDKTRIQPYEGIVISKKGKGKSKTFTVRKIGVDNVGVERIFPLFSPNITKLEVTRKGKVRKSKLYYLRDKKGRAAIRVKERKAKKS